MKSVLISIQPKRCELIANGKKTIEVRKTAPKCEVPFKCYIYCTKPSAKGKYFVGGLSFNNDELYRTPDGKIKYGDSIELMAIGGENYSKDNFLNGKVIGVFVCDEIIEWQYATGHKYYVDYPDDCTSYFPYLKCHSEATGLKCSEIENYGKGKPLYGWHISDLKIYDKPKKLSEFRKPLESVHCNRWKWCECDEGCVGFDGTDFYCRDYWNWANGITRPPQSWQYVEELGWK